MVFVWHCVSVWYWPGDIYRCRENGCILSRWTDTRYSERMRNERDKHRAETHDKHSDVFLFLSFPFFFFLNKIHLNSGCVCCLASPDHVHTASLDPKPTTPLWISHSCSHTQCCFKLLHQKNGDALLWLCPLHNTSVYIYVSCEHRYYKTATEHVCTAVWMWSTSIYPYLLMYVQMNSSPVIVFYSLQDKWSLKENPCLDPLCLEWLFVG